jgi:hypothetical protein
MIKWEEAAVARCGREQQTTREWTLCYPPKTERRGRIRGLCVSLTPRTILWSVLWVFCTLRNQTRRYACSGCLISVQFTSLARTVDISQGEVLHNASSYLKAASVWDRRNTWNAGPRPMHVEVTVGKACVVVPTRVECVYVTYCDGPCKMRIRGSGCLSSFVSKPVRRIDEFYYCPSVRPSPCDVNNRWEFFWSASYV